MKIKPLGNNILIKRRIAEETTANGIYLPGKQQDKQEGIVEAIGEEVKTVKVKDLVIFKRYGSSEELEVDGVKYILASEKDILAQIL